LVAKDLVVVLFQLNDDNEDLEKKWIFIPIISSIENSKLSYPKHYRAENQAMFFFLYISIFYFYIEEDKGKEKKKKFAHY
jgi:hypothetical protein